MVEAPYDYRVIRHRHVPGYATFARMFDAKGIELMVIIERPWVDADHNGKRDHGVSRFVPGLYSMFLRAAGTGKRNYDLMEYEGVPDVTNAQVHVANFPWQLEGCQATGTAFGDVEYTGPTTKLGYYDLVHGTKYPGVQGSMTAHNKWMTDVRGLMAREGRSRVWVKVVDRFAA